MSLPGRSALRLSPLTRPLTTHRLPAATFALRSRQTRRHNSTVLEGLGTCVASTTEAFSALHQAGLPWYLVIPLVATGLNFTIRLPAQYLSRSIHVKNKELAPFKRAWVALHMSNRERSGQSTLWTLQKELARINRTYGVSRWRRIVAIGAPIVPFVLVSEAVRRLAGSPMTWLGEQLGLDRFLDVLVPGGSTLADPTLAQGGCLWFADLTMADPYGALPVICAGILSVAAWSRVGRERLMQLLSVDEPGMSQWQRGINALGRALLILPLFPLLFWNLPSAVFLYWAPTFAFNSVNAALLKRWLPEPQVSPGPVKTPPRKQYPPALVRSKGYPVPKHKSKQ